MDERGSKARRRGGPGLGLGLGLGLMVGLGLVVAGAAGCGGEDDASDASDEGAIDSGAMDGSSDGADGDPPGSIDVPSVDYCAGVAAWDEGSRAFESEVVELVNQARAQGGDCGNGGSFGASGPLSMEARLRCAARVHSLDMVERGFFDHVNPDGESPFDRMERAGYQFRNAGENIAAGQTTPSEVVDGWLQSPGHCANILSPDFTEIGVGYMLAPQDPFAHYWTQTFGAPL